MGMEMILIEDLIDEILESKKPTTFGEYVQVKHYRNRELFLEDVDSVSCREFIRLIIDFNKEDIDIEPSKRKPILLYINSDGGDVEDGYGLLDTILMSKTPIHTICVAKAYSMGGMIFIAGHHRTMFPKSSVMLHQGAASLHGDMGKVKDTMKFVDQLVKIGDNFVLERTKIPIELYEQKIANDWYLCSEDCLKLGITDEIATALM